MNEQDQRIAIAEACGWEFHPECGPLDFPWVYRPTKARAATETLPNYLHDRNAMQSALLTLNPEQQRQFMEELATLVEADGYQIDADHAWRTVTAKLEHYSKAFLKTIGKWKERS